ncbi:MAG: outer membrane beta-barrel family protein [Saprospiraceae bacterium]|nr:outer membrane beta-barrel family protein [Saprospiraceae bacterium]
MIRLIFSFLCVFSLFNITAQPADLSNLDASDIKRMIKGIVQDVETGQALEFAAVSVYVQGSETLTGGTVTDINGVFAIEVDQGTYDVKIEYISFDPLWIREVVVSRDEPVADLGTITLSPSAQMLEEVEVTGEKSQFQLGLDKKVFNVGKDLVTRSGSAADILDNIPSVSVDIEGNVSLRGSQNVRILVDGRPSGLVGLSGNDALRALQGDLIERVEVVTNPSARYDAEGMAGIINIVLKKEQRKGVNGSFTLNGGYPTNFGASSNVNFRRKDVNFFLNYGARYRNSPGDGFLYQEYYQDDITTYLEQDRDRTRAGWSHNVRLGTDIFFSENSVLTGAFMYRISDESNESSLVYRDFDQFRELQTITTRDETQTGDEPSLEYNLNYKRTFGKDHELTMAVQYDESTETESSEYVERVLNPDLSPAGIPDLNQRSVNDERQTSWLGQIDYVRPIGENGKFEAGYKASIRHIGNDYLVEEFADNDWIRLDNLSNDFNYDEDIHAGYLIYGNKINRFSYQFGVRAEYSHVITELVETGEVNDRDYTNLFPSVHFGYELAGENTLQLSYSRRVQRPRFWYLNPFFTFSDSRNFWGGNPNLDPEFTNSMEIGHVKYWDNASLSSSIYYRHSTGVIQRIRTIDDEGITRTMPQNLATRDAFGFEFTFSKDILDTWKVDGNLNLFRSITDGGEFGDADTYSWQTRMNSRVTLFNKLETQLRLNYRGPQETTQGRSQGTFHADLGMSMDVLKRNGTLTLNVSDVFNTRKRRYVTEGVGFYAEGEFRWRPRSTTLTFTYRLNQKKQRQRGNRGDWEGGEEMMGEF